MQWDGWDSKQSLSEAVVYAIAAEEDVKPEELAQPLYPAVDPDALNSLFRTDEGEVAIRYLDYEIVARAGGTIEVTSADSSNT